MRLALAIISALVTSSAQAFVATAAFMGAVPCAGLLLEHQYARAGREAGSPTAVKMRRAAQAFERP